MRTVLRKFLSLVALLLLVVFPSCTSSEALPDALYLSSLYVNDVEINGEFVPPAIYARWSLTTVNNNPEVMQKDGVAGRYLVLAPHSAVAFKLIVIARDDTADEIGMWKIENGSVKRAGDNTAVLVTATTDIVIRDDAGWSIAVTGLPVEDALNITVIGDAVNETKWSAVLYGVEVHY